MKEFLKTILRGICTIGVSFYAMISLAGSGILLTGVLPAETGFTAVGTFFGGVFSLVLGGIIVYALGDLTEES